MSIEFNGQKWTIKRTTKPVGGERKNRAILGESDEAENMIIIDGTLPKTRQQEVLIHELVHVADMDVPEFLVGSISRSLFGLMSNNALLAANWFDRIVDGDATTEEANRINEDNIEVKEAVSMFGGFRTVDEGPDDRNGLVRTDIDGTSTIWSLDVMTDGSVNRVACHRAELALLSGLPRFTQDNYRSIARELACLFTEVLGEDPHPLIATTARG